MSRVRRYGYRSDIREGILPSELPKLRRETSNAEPDHCDFAITIKRCYDSYTSARITCQSGFDG